MYMYMYTYTYTYNYTYTYEYTYTYTDTIRPIVHPNDYAHGLGFVLCYFTNTGAFVFCASEVPIQNEEKVTSTKQSIMKMYGSLFLSIYSINMDMDVYFGF